MFCSESSGWLGFGFARFNRRHRTDGDTPVLMSFWITESVRFSWQSQRSLLMLFCRVPDLNIGHQGRINTARKGDQRRYRSRELFFSARTFVPVRGQNDITVCLFDLLKSLRQSRCRYLPR